MEVEVFDWKERRNIITFQISLSFGLLLCKRVSTQLPEKFCFNQGSSAKPCLWVVLHRSKENLLKVLFF